MTAAALLRTLASSRAALEDACRAVDVPKGSLLDESVIISARFRDTANRLSNAVSGLIEAEVALRSFVATFGTDGLALDEEGLDVDE